jgi:hypothetical protein
MDERIITVLRPSRTSSTPVAAVPVHTSYRTNTQYEAMSDASVNVRSRSDLSMIQCTERLREEYESRLLCYGKRLLGMTLSILRNKSLRSLVDSLISY